MAAIGRALGDLTDPSARLRVLKWAAERFATEQQPVAPVAVQQVVVANPAVAADADLAVDSLNDIFVVAVQDVDDDLGEFAAPPAQVQPIEEPQKLPLETLLRSLAADFRAFADEWNGAAA